MDLEEDTYDKIFQALKHPIRRRILRELESQPATFTELLKSLGIDNGLLNYHLNNLNELITKSEGEKYSLSEDTEIIESLEHGSIIFWRQLWEKLELSKIIKKQVRLKNTRIKLDVEKYIEMLTTNRCIDPLSKLGTSRWLETTCYQDMHGYSELPLSVNYFYRT